MSVASRTNVRGTALLSLLFCAASISSAANITYSVNLNIGGAATATGDIVTNGTLGALYFTDVLDWNLLLNDGTSTVDLLGPLSGSNSIIQFNDLFGHENWTATATRMLYNFSAGGTSFVYFSSLPAVDSQATLLTFNTESILGPTPAEALRVNNGAVYSTLYSGTQVMGTVPSESGAPEPSSSALLCTGLALLSYRRSKSECRQTGASRDGERCGGGMVILNSEILDLNRR